MKLFVKAITCIVLFITSIIFCLSITANKIVKEDISSLLANKLNINEQLNNVLSSFSPLLLQDTSNLIDQSKTNALIQKYTPIILQDLANESHQKYDINTDLQNLLLENIDTFKSIMKDSLSDSKKEAILKAAIQALDMQTLYDNIIDNARARLSNQEVFVIKIASFLINRNTMILSGILMASITICMVLLEYRKKQYTYFTSVAYISSAFTVFLMYIASRKIIALQTIDFSLLLIFSLCYICIAIALFFICKHIKSVSTS